MTDDSIIIAPEDWPDAYMELKQRLEKECEKWEQIAEQKLLARKYRVSQSPAQRTIKFT